MNMKKIAVLLLSAATLFTAASCAGGDAESPEETFRRETFEKETYFTVGDGQVIIMSNLPLSIYEPDSSVGQWLDGCAASDRDDFFDAYALRCDTPADGNTTFTYLVYYPHGGTPLAASAELLEGESGYLLNLRYTAGEGTESYALCRLEVTLPTQTPPRLRVLVGEEPLGVLSTLTETPIP